MFEITFLRHGESIGNAEGFIQGQSDSPLSFRGKEQALALATRWKAEEVVFNKIISSPLTRAKETAEIINRKLKCPIDFDPIWMERDFGNLTGVNHEDAQISNLRLGLIKLHDPIGETGESEWMLFQRAGEALQSILNAPPGKYLIVSHGGILNKVFHTIFGIKPQVDFQSVHFRLDNTGFAKITYIPETNQWRVLSINDRIHLSNFKSNIE
jgi:broad specificity phosphatase PhoE